MMYGAEENAGKGVDDAREAMAEEDELPVDEPAKDELAEEPKEDGPSDPELFEADSAVDAPNDMLNIPAIHTSKSWVTVNPPSPPVTPRLERIIIVGIAIIGVAVAILILLGCARFVLSLLN